MASRKLFSPQRPLWLLGPFLTTEAIELMGPIVLHRTLSSAGHLWSAAFGNVCYTFNESEKIEDAFPIISDG